MYVRFRTLVAVSAMVASVLAAPRSGFAQSGCVPADAEWLNTEVEITGIKAKNAFTIEADKVTIRETIADIWVQYVFKAADIKSIDVGNNDDGAVRVTINVSPAQMTNSSGEKGTPATIPVDMASEFVDQMVKGLETLKKGCAK